MAPRTFPLASGCCIRVWVTSLRQGVIISGVGVAVGSRRALGRDNGWVTGHDRRLRQGVVASFVGVAGRRRRSLDRVNY